VPVSAKRRDYRLEKTAREVKSRERGKRILQLRLGGASFAAIGKQIGISEVGAWKGYKRALALIPARP
jgi:hypothetical protein